MRKLILVGVVAWTAVAGAVLLFWPWSTPFVACAWLVDPSAGCLAELAAANEARFWGQTVPFVAIVIAGYLLVGVLAIRFRSSRGAAASRPGLG